MDHKFFIYIFHLSKAFYGGGLYFSGGKGTIRSIFCTNTKEIEM